MTFSPTARYDRQLFQNNVQSTLNLFLSAAEHNLRRVVFSSSAFVWFNYQQQGSSRPATPGTASPRPAPDALQNSWYDPAEAETWGPELRYLPIDEDHPARPTETYGLSKVVGEEIGRMIARSAPPPFLGLPPPFLGLPPPCVDQLPVLGLPLPFLNHSQPLSSALSSALALSGLPPPRSQRCASPTPRTSARTRPSSQPTPNRPRPPRSRSSCGRTPTRAMWWEVATAGAIVLLHPLFL